LNRQPNLRERIHAAFRLTRIRGVKLTRLLTKAEYRHGLRRGVAASVEHAGVPFSDEVATVIDLGASRGQFALFASGRFPSARIIAFEPQPGPMAELTSLLGERVDARPMAVGAKRGTATMNVSASDDSSSLLRIGETQRTVFPGTGPVGTIEVEVTTLDSEFDGDLDRPCLLKIDVQGLELEALKGASRTLAQVDEALIECSFVELYEGQAMADEVIALMLGAGLRLAGVYGATTDVEGRMVQADFHFRREQAR
jgi:FkbM family methyltransferase